MRWISVIALSVGLIASFTAFGVHHYAPRIQKDLQDRASSALTQKGVSFDHIAFDGRDGKITIEKSEKLPGKEVQKIAEGVFGVRRALIEEIVKEEPSFFAERVGNRLHINGKFPQKEAIERFVERAKEVFGKDNVTPSIEENKFVLRTDYLAAIANFLQLMERVGPEARLRLKDRTVTLGGLVPDPQTKASLEKLARDRMPAGVKFQSEIVVPARDTSGTFMSDLGELLDAIRLNFHFDSTRLTAETMGNLNLLKETLDEYQIDRIRISGFTDSIGTDAYNMRLSRRRAVSIEKKLASFGNSGRRFQIRACGEKHPVADNRTAEGRQLNRRVAFEVLEAGK